MSRFEFKLPDIGEGVTEGEIVQWLIAVGDTVHEDQPMVEVMTDKATVTITSPKAGRVLETHGGVGEIVPVHNVLVVFDLDGAAAPEPSAPKPERAATKPAAPPPPAPKADAKRDDDGPAATAVGDIKESLPGMKPAAPAAGRRDGFYSEKPLATPATRKLARDLGVDLHTVPPTGPHGRVTKDDVRSARGGSASAPAAPTEGRGAAPATPTAPTGAGFAPQPVAPLADDDIRTPLRGVRKRIFEGMSRSKHSAAHFTFVEECDATALIDLRNRLRPAAEAKGVKLTYLPFFVKAVVAALRLHPSLNSAFDEVSQEIVERKRLNIGIASATEAGLMVPVVRDADRKSLLEIGAEIQRLGEATKSGKVSPGDLGGSTFTITSLGAQGGLFATPVLNYPEVGILGIHQMKKKPVVRNDEIVIGTVMLLSLSFDHRIIDGHIGAAFAYEIIDYLQNPDRLFLEL